MWVVEVNGYKIERGADLSNANPIGEAFVEQTCPTL